MTKDSFTLKTTLTLITVLFAGGISTPESAPNIPSMNAFALKRVRVVSVVVI